MENRSSRKKFKVNLISFGRLGFSFAKEFIEEFCNSRRIKEFTIWFPESGDSELLIDQLRIVTRDQMQFKPKPFRFMSELKEITRDSATDLSVENITVLCSRFDYGFRFCKENDDELTEKVIDRSYLNIQNYDDAYRKIKKKRNRVQEIVTNVQKQTYLSKNRSTDLGDSIVGTIELAKVFIGYKGYIINAVNEVDTTTKLLVDISDVEYRRVIGLSDNDRLRFENEIFKYARQSDEISLTDVFVPVFGTHNQFMTAIGNRIQIREKFLKDLTNLPTCNFSIEELKKRVIDIGDRIYAKRGASDLDSATGLLNMVKSVVCNSKPVIRASCRVRKEDGFCTGILVCHENGYFKPHNFDDYLGSMDAREKEVFVYGNSVQTMINEELAKSEILFD